jgi:3,4-dihydroxy 2-butanone 4-phosphate synthase / GTP cyclohydrolase II
MRRAIEDGIRAVAERGFVIVADDENRENEGDLIAAAEAVTAEQVAFMIRHTSGIICQPMLGEKLDDLELPQMVVDNNESHRTAFTISVDYRFGTTTGVSAEDRTATIRALASPASRGSDFLRPGHVFPLRYRPGGVLKRAGHTEAAVDLAQLAGFSPTGILAELTNDDGTMMRMDELLKFGHEHRIPVITVADLIRYRAQESQLVVRKESVSVDTRFGRFTAHVFCEMDGETQHLALTRGSLKNAPLVRVHRGCALSEFFGSKACTCAVKLEAALERIREADDGVVIYLQGTEALEAHGISDPGDSAELPKGYGWREYGIGAQMLQNLGVNRIRLLTNSTINFPGLAGHNLDIVERVPLIAPVIADTDGSKREGEQ